MTPDQHSTGKTNETSLDGLAAHLIGVKPGQRILVAVAGPPASGKSTLADGLRASVNALGRSAALLAMDGFHLDDQVLVPRGLRLRKGAPHTFDVAGLTCILERLRANAEPEIAVPVFDRDLEIARAGAAMIPTTAEVVIIEGNYLLLDADGWRDLRTFFDVTVLLSTSEDALRERLLARWSGLPKDEALAKLEENDLPNGRLILHSSVPADFTIQT